MKEFTSKIKRKGRGKRGAQSIEPNLPRPKRTEMRHLNLSIDHPGPGASKRYGIDLPPLIHTDRRFIIEKSCSIHEILKTMVPSKKSRLSAIRDELFSTDITNLTLNE